MIVVTTPTGRIGSQAIEPLLGAGEEVRVVARDPARLAPQIRERVSVVQGSTDDEDVLNRAFKGAHSLLWIVPPSFTQGNDSDYYLRFTRPAVRAVQKQGVQQVVAVSGLGRGVVQKSQLLLASFAKDTEFEQAGINYRTLYCTSFMDNLLDYVPLIKNQGLLSWPGNPDLKVPQVATRDIAARAVQLLLDKSWTGQDGHALLGPEDLSYNDMAAILTEVLGFPVRFQPASVEEYTASLVKLGAGEMAARGIAELYDEVSEGVYNAEPRNAQNTTPTTFRQWCEEELRPAIES